MTKYLNKEVKTRTLIVHSAIEMSSHISWHYN